MRLQEIQRSIYIGFYCSYNCTLNWYNFNFLLYFFRLFTIFNWKNHQSMLTQGHLTYNFDFQFTGTVISTLIRCCVNNYGHPSRKQSRRMRLFHFRCLPRVIAKLWLIPDDFRIKSGWHGRIWGETTVNPWRGNIYQTQYVHWENGPNKVPVTNNVCWLFTDLLCPRRTCIFPCFRWSPRLCTWRKSDRWGSVWAAPRPAPPSWLGEVRSCPARGAPASWPLLHCRRQAPPT